MRKKPKLTKDERIRIATLHRTKHGIREIARILDRSPGSISEEIRRNRTAGKYNSYDARRKAAQRRWSARSGKMKIEGDPTLRAYVIAKLDADWTPNEIASKMREDREPFYASKTTIYKWAKQHQRRLWAIRVTKKCSGSKVPEVTWPHIKRPRNADDLALRKAIARVLLKE